MDVYYLKLLTLILTYVRIILKLDVIYFKKISGLI